MFICFSFFCVFCSSFSVFSVWTAFSVWFFIWFGSQLAKNAGIEPIVVQNFNLWSSASQPTKFKSKVFKGCLLKIWLFLIYFSKVRFLVQILPNCWKKVLKSIHSNDYFSNFCSIMEQKVVVSSFVPFCHISRLWEKSLAALLPTYLACLLACALY